MSAITLIAPELRRVEECEAEGLVLFRFGEKKPLAGITSLVDWRLLGHLSRLIIEGFFSGKPDETLLMPLGHRMPQKHLLLFGMGERGAFGQEVFERELGRMFDTTRALGCRGLVLALPGRVENECDIAQATEWFLKCYEANGDDQDIFIAEPTGAQKAMIPVFERWRLKRLLP